MIIPASQAIVGSHIGLGFASKLRFSHMLWLRIAIVSLKSSMASQSVVGSQVEYGFTFSSWFSRR